MKSINLGFKLIEFDLIETSDGRLIAAHDWKHFRSITGESDASDESMSFDEFRSRKIIGQYRVLSAEDINDVFKSRPDLYLVTDKSSNYRLIRKSFDFQDRLFVEVFDSLSYIYAVLNGVRRPMLALGSMRYGDWLERARIGLLGVKYVTVNSKILSSHSDFFKALSDAGIYIFVFTLNNKDDIINVIINYRSVVYTDYWNFHSSGCENLECESY